MDLKSVNDIFTNRILRIPSYQRGYSWQNNKPLSLKKEKPWKDVKGQLRDLWDDILNIPEGSWHYTGLLTLVASKEKKYPHLPRHSQFVVVDGQQRITSILILIKVIIDKAKEFSVTLGDREGDAEYQYLYIKKNATAYIFGYEEDNPSDKFFRKHILGLDEIEDESKESSYTEKLQKAKRFFSKAVDLYLEKGTDARVRLSHLYDRITTSLKFNEYILPEELDEFVVFETMNNRGKPLSELEKLKNRLMYLNSKLSLSDSSGVQDEKELADMLLAQRVELETEINKAWITIYESLGANKLHLLDDEDFVKNHWIMYFHGYNRSEANVYSNFLFDEHFNLQNVYDGLITPAKIKAYIKSLQSASRWWNKLNYPQFFSETESKLKEVVMSIHRIGLRAPFKPLILGILMLKNREEFLEAISQLELYNFKVFNISNRKSNAGDSKFYWMANEVYSCSLNAEQAIAKIKWHTSEYYNFNYFRNLITELFDTGEMQGYYKWPGIRYFLFEYDNKLRVHNLTNTKVSEIQWQDFNAKKTIEHILPLSAIPDLKEYAKQKEKKENDVKTSWEKIQNNWNAFSSYPSWQRRRFANSLGNLLALSSSDNSSVGNGPFLHKTDQANKGPEYVNRGYKYDSMSARLVANYPDWTPETITGRGILMLNFLLEKIGEDPKAISYGEKLKLLGLKFLITDPEKTT